MLFTIWDFNRTFTVFHLIPMILDVRSGAPATLCRNVFFCSWSWYFRLFRILATCHDGSTKYILIIIFYRYLVRNINLLFFFKKSITQRYTVIQFLRCCAHESLSFQWVESFTHFASGFKSAVPDNESFHDKRQVQLFFWRSVYMLCEKQIINQIYE